MNSCLTSCRPGHSTGVGHHPPIEAQAAKKAVLSRVGISSHGALWLVQHIQMHIYGDQDGV